MLGEIDWAGKRVLDVGCGTGLICYEIARRKASSVTGIDFSKGGITEAGRLYHLPTLTYKCESLAEHRSSGEKYDIIISLGTLEHMDAPFAALKSMVQMLRPGGHLIVTCPNWVNPRGYILQALRFLFNAPVTLADLHYLTPVEFEKWAKRLRADLQWRTFDQDWGHGRRMLADFERRLPAILRDMGLRKNTQSVTPFISWLREHMLPFDHQSDFSGATGLYHFRLRSTRGRSGVRAHAE